MTSTAAAANAAPKPLLRGVSHEIAAFAALVGWIFIAVTAPSADARLSGHAYGASLFLLFAVSAAYHRPSWSPRARAWMRRLDHSAIFLLIAGTYTPLCMLVGDRRAWLLLIVVWTGALLGVVQSILWVRAPKPLVAALYVLLGWAVLPVLPAVRAAVGATGLALLGAGGAAYTVGAVVYATRRPDPWPRVFGYHEIFHALVIVAAGFHFAVTARAIGALR